MFALGRVKSRSTGRSNCSATGMATCMSFIRRSRSSSSRLRMISSTEALVAGSFASTVWGP